MSVSTLERGTDLRYVHQDHLTGTSLTMDTSGNEVASVKYYPFGETRSSSGTLDTDRMFTGQRLDDTGLYYYGARMYDPAIGRFISPDTVVPGPADPRSFNRYSYCLNNPLKHIDPAGNEVYIIDFGVSAGFGVGGQAGLMLAFDTYGGLALLHYEGGGLTTPNAGVGASIALTDDETIKDVLGSHFQISGSVAGVISTSISSEEIVEAFEPDEGSGFWDWIESIGSVDTWLELAEVVVDNLQIGYSQDISGGRAQSGKLKGIGASATYNNIGKLTMINQPGEYELGILDADVPDLAERFGIPSLQEAAVMLFGNDVPVMTPLQSKALRGYNYYQYTEPNPAIVERWYQPGGIGWWLNEGYDVGCGNQPWE